MDAKSEPQGVRFIHVFIALAVVVFIANVIYFGAKTENRGYPNLHQMEREFDALGIRGEFNPLGARESAYKSQIQRVSRQFQFTGPAGAIFPKADEIFQRSGWKKKGEDAFRGGKERVQYYCKGDFDGSIDVMESGPAYSAIFNITWQSGPGRSTGC